MILVSGKKYNKLKGELSLAKIEIEKLKDSLKCEKDRNYRVLEDKSKKENNYLKQIENLKNSGKKFEELINFKTNLNREKDDKILELEKKLRLSNSARGGMQRIINALKRTIEELEKSEKVLKVKKIRSCKGTTQKMKAPRVQKNSVRRTLKEIDALRGNSED
ncbi:unknown [Firmicutes bacterium CAG:460]|nr:unknown [Firmicutes bacterium CAG:460]